MNPEVTEYYLKAPIEYIELLKKARQDIFEITSNITEMSEVFSYQIAVYKYGKKPLFSIAYFKNHCSFISQDKNIVAKIPELNDFKISGTSIHFDNQHPLDTKLLKKIISVRLDERKKEK